MNLQTIPLTSLSLSAHNARKTGGINVADLAASIVAHGLLQNLTVTAGEDGYQVIAGGRRLRALQLLHSEGRLPPELASVPCRVLTNGQVTEASTAENTIREAMHPADQFEAFRTMVDAGKSVTDVAAHFGVAELVVKQRLKLANVSPKIVALYREGKASLGQLQVLALVDDMALQEKAWFGVKQDYERSEHNLRQRLMKAEVPSTDPRVRFVGLAAYEAAGGAVRRDLFDAREGGYVADVRLLDRLVREAFAREVAKYEAAGWSWVEAHSSLDYSDQAKYGRFPAESRTRKPTPEEQQRLKAIDARQKAITVELDVGRASMDFDDEPLLDERETLEAEALALHEALVEWPAAAKAQAGVLLYLDDYRGLVVDAGRLKPGQSVTVASHGSVKTSDTKAKKPDLSDAMVHRLTAHKTAALQLKLAMNPDTALRALVECLLGALIYSTTAQRALQVTATNQARALDLHIRAGAKDLEHAPARLALKGLVETWHKRGLPTTSTALRGFLDKQNRDALVELLAFAAAMTVDAEHGNHSKRPDADALAAELKLDMAAYWKPSPAAFLEHVPKAVAIQAVTEARGKAEGARLESLKREAVVAEAAKLLDGTGWLPKPLRGPGYKLASASDAKVPAAAPGVPKKAKAGESKRPPAKKKAAPAKKKPAARKKVAKAKGGRK